MWDQLIVGLMNAEKRSRGQSIYCWSHITIFSPYVY